MGFREVGLQPIVAIGVGLVERADHLDGTAGGRIISSVSVCYVRVYHAGVSVYARESVLRSLLPMRKFVSISLVCDHVLLVVERKF